MKKIFCCPALELFHCLPLWKTVLFVRSGAFSLSTATFLLSTPVDNSETTWKKATKCNNSIKLLQFENNYISAKYLTMKSLASSASSLVSSLDGSSVKWTILSTSPWPLRPFSKMQNIWFFLLSYPQNERKIS